MQEIFDFAVVGGGASGMAAAIAAANLGDRVLLLEKSSFLGRKIKASGNGRCNLMNINDSVYFGGSGFVEKVLQEYGPESLKSFWENLGLKLTEEEGRVYPATFQASSVLDALKAGLKASGVEIRLQAMVQDIICNGGAFRLDTGDGTFLSRRVLIASGGASYPKLGGNDSGYRLLESFGHKTVSILPALCPLTTDKKSISGLSGIRAKSTISLYGTDGMLRIREKGEVLFTDYGISGICAMQCARFAEDGCTAELDLSEFAFPEGEGLADYLRDRRKKAGMFPPEQLLTGFLMPKLAFAVLKQTGISMRDRTAGSLSDAELNMIEDKVHRYTLQIKGTKGLEEAQVTAGGAACEEFNPHTMESKIVKGLHAAGEVLDVDGGCGGFNLMFAFASGILAGLNGRRVERI